MDINEVTKAVLSYKKSIQQIATSLKIIARLMPDATANLANIQRNIEKIKAELANVAGSTFSSDIHEWLTRYETQMAQIELRVQQAFGNELERHLLESGISLKGHYPTLEASIFRVEVDTTTNRFILWYGPKQEKIGSGPLSANKVASLITKTREGLGCKLGPDEFLKFLWKAYFRIKRLSNETRAPIVDVLCELANELQPQKFRTDPRREYYKDYTRVDFSYDLMRIQGNRSLRLHGATRALTKRRADFLWVPQDENGKGEYFSHLEILEN